MRWWANTWSCPTPTNPSYESFVHAGAHNECKVTLRSIQSEHISPENVAQLLHGVDGVLVAPGFGERGFEGKLDAMRYVRENNIPFFGICLGMQWQWSSLPATCWACPSANSTEMDPLTPNPVIAMMEEQKNITQKGGTMRLGAYACDLRRGSQGGQVSTAATTSASGTATATSSTTSYLKANLRKPA